MAAVCSTRLKHLMDLYEVPYEVIEHVPAYDSQTTAQSLHMSAKALAKSVVLQGESQTCIAVLPACYRVNLDRFSQMVGEQVRLATEEEIADLLPDCEVGAIPPFGRLYGLPVYVDVNITVHKKIAFPAGTHRDVILMGYNDFESLAQPEICSFATKEGGHPQQADYDTWRHIP